MTRDHVFVSYSHKDAAWLDLLRDQLAPDLRNHRLDCFDDHQITVGENWKARITAAIARATVAVLLVSPNFFESQFIMDHELPPLLAASAAGVLTIIWLPIAGAEFGPVNHLQAFTDPTHPIETFDDAARLRCIVSLARKIERLTTRRIPSNLPYSAASGQFIGRERELAAIDESLTRHNSAAITQVASRAVTGLGGIGKTRLAVEYAYRHRDRFTALLFARANTPDELRNSLAALCAADVLDIRAGSGTADEQYAAAVRWLQENPGWLLILDNVDTPDGMKAVSTLLGKLHSGQIVITSRLTTWDAAIRQSLDVMTPEEAREFLLQRADRPDTEADSVAAKLGYLPLALAQAAAYVRRNGPDFAGYLRLYTANEQRMLQSGLPESAEYPLPVFLTGRTTIDKLPAGARRILQLHAWLAPSPFPIDLYIRGAELVSPGATEPDIREWIGALVDYSLATRRSDDTISIHGLVQAVERHDTTRHLPQSSSPPTFTIDAAYAAIRRLFGEHAARPSWEPASRVLWDLLIPHAESLRAGASQFDPSSDVVVLWKLSLAYRSRGDYRAAIPPLEECLQSEQEFLGREHPATLASVNNLASVYESQGRYGEAEPLYWRALEAQERALGAEHPDTLTSVNNLALLYQSQGRHGEAEPLYRRALEARERALGAEHPDTLVSVNNLAYLYHGKGQYGEAEPLYRRAMDGSELVLGAEHPNTLTSVNNLANLYESQGRYGEAEPLYRRAIEARELVLGTEHPITLTSVNNLANLYERQGRFGEAELLYRRAMEAMERVLGARHPNTLTSVNNLAYLHASQGRFGEAEPLYRRALNGFEEALGPDHPSTQTVRNNHTRCLAALNSPPATPPR